MGVSVETEQQWPIPAGLSGQGEVAAKVIRELFEEKDVTYHGGGGKFYTPQEWRDRGEDYGRNSVLVVTHDGGDHAAVFNPDYGAYELMDELRKRLDENGLFVEQCTTWYSAVYPTS